MTRLRTSRPSWSVPKRWRCRPSSGNQVGPLSRSRSDCLMGSYGLTSGAAIATTTTARTKTAEAQTKSGTFRRERAPVPTAPLLSPDARVEDAIGKIHQEVEDHEDRRREEDARLHHRVVPIEDGLDRQPTDPRPGEDRLRHYGPAQHVAQLQPHDRDDGNGRVPHRMLGE